MPTVQLYGQPCRVRPMLNAIGAQEALEQHGVHYRTSALRGPAAGRAYERERLALAGRRNRAEAKLRPEEHAAWRRWRAALPGERAAVYSVLTDLPDPNASVMAKPPSY